MRTIAGIASALLVGVGVSAGPRHSPNAFAASRGAEIPAFETRVDRSRHENEAAGADAFQPSVFGLESQVDDVAAASRELRESLGFAPVLAGGEIARLDKDGFTVVLVHSDAPAASTGTAQVVLNPSANDPSGAVNEIVVDLESSASTDFFGRLGFRRAGHDRLAELSFERAGAASLLVRRRASRPREPGARAIVLLLGVERIDAARDELVRRGIEVGPTRTSPIGQRAAVTAPSGIRIDLVERSPAQLAFERLAALAGSWEGKSSQGWTSRCEIEVIARGSAVLERTNFEAHSGETMLTLFHMDGERLLLTHYCVAGNQPRLVASEIENDQLHFTFLDGTNLPSRDSGHMDEAVLRFTGFESFSSLWSFYRAGKTSWMEEIRYTRLAADDSERRRSERLESKPDTSKHDESKRDESKRGG